jgi:hypothetical protein
LTDFTFTYGYSKNWVHTDPYDTWTNLMDPATPYPGTAVNNTAASYPGMYSMRSKLIWWGAGVIFNNSGYREGWSSVIDNSCLWETIP